MLTARQLLDLYYLPMRQRVLSLAADLDRLQAPADGAQVIQNDPRMRELNRAIEILLETHPGRVQRVQELLSDTTPPPP
ncbi:MAG: hypothetical protein IT446_00340 [Phycisphaerales bacterium]|nr:hypothetical protein [Phycisphaerales bacterium]